MEYPDIPVETYSRKKATLATLGKLSICATNCGAFCQGIYWVSRNHPEFATPIINEMLPRVVETAFDLWQSGKVDQAMLQTDKLCDHPKRRAFEACCDILRNAEREIRRHHDAETITHLEKLAGHPSASIMRPAASILMMLDHTPPVAAVRRILSDIEEADCSLNYGIKAAGSRHRSIIGRVAKEWEAVCEQLAEVVYGKLLLDRRRETLLSNETRPDIIIDDGGIKRDDHGTICYCNLVIDAKTGSIPDQTQYGGWCKRLEYWYNGQYWSKPWKYMRTHVSVVSGRELCKLATDHGREDLALEIGRLMGLEGDYVWRWVQSFLEPETAAKPKRSRSRKSAAV